MMSMESMKLSKEPHADATKYLDAAFKAWGGFTTFVMTVFWFLSSGHLSFLLTLSSLVSMFSFLLVAMAIVRSGSVAGISLKMMECYVAIFAFRLCCIIPFVEYLPIDTTGDWLYHIGEVAGLVISVFIVCCCRFWYKSTYDPNTDTVQQQWLVLPVLAASLIVHPHLTVFFPADVAWTFALYLECVSVLPQLFMFTKECKTQSHTSHFLAAQALSRLFSFMFWAVCFTDLADPDHHINQYVGHWVVGMQLLQLVIMGDFVYHYIRCIQKGIPLEDMFVENV